MGRFIPEFMITPFLNKRLSRPKLSQRQLCYIRMKQVCVGEVKKKKKHAMFSNFEGYI